MCHGGFVLHGARSVQDGNRKALRICNKTSLDQKFLQLSTTALNMQALEGLLETPSGGQWCYITAVLHKQRLMKPLQYEPPGPCSQKNTSMAASLCTLSRSRFSRHSEGAAKDNNNWEASMHGSGGNDGPRESDLGFHVQRNYKHDRFAWALHCKHN